MSWLLFSLLAALVWAIVNINDKFILTKLVTKPIVPLMILGFISLIAAGIIYLVKGLPYLSAFNLFLAFIAGILFVLMNLFYFKAVQLEEISRVIPLFYISPIFILILAWFFLGEIFTTISYAGIFLLIAGAILISVRHPFKITVGKAYWFMILSTLSLASNQVISKYLLGIADFWTVFAYVRIASFIALIPIFFIYFPYLAENIRVKGSKVLGFVSFNESMNLVGVIFITVAASTGFVTLVNTLSSIQPLFVFVFAVLLSLFFPKIIKEELNKPTLALKLVAIILMIIGGVLIS